MLENFLNKSNFKFNGRFDYSKFIYTNAKTKSIIICPTHGEFLQTPDKHLQSKYGCKLCWDIEKKKIDRDYVKGPDIINKKMFLKRCIEKYKDKFKYDLSNYTGICGEEITITCSEHGEFKSKPHTHLLKNNKYGCVECSNKNRKFNKTQDYDYVISILKNKYDSKYIYPDYNRINYINKKSKIDIICTEHGLFTKSVNKHQSGQHCFVCKTKEMVLNNDLIGGYNLQLFENKPELKEKNSILYYLKINNGDLYKIGITTVSTQSRIKSLKSRSKGFIKSVEILFEKEMKLIDSYNTESKILNDNIDNRIYKKWSTELFNKNILNY
jgi:hypothetical protein